jgi:hypothetical protein
MLLLISLAGIAVATWSFFASATVRPTPFALLSKDISTVSRSYGLSPEESQLLSLRVSELQSAHSSEVRRYTTAYSISFMGLIGVSVLSLLTYVVARPK